MKNGEAMDCVMVRPIQGYTKGNIFFVCQNVSYMMGYDNNKIQEKLDAYEFYKRIMLLCERPSSLKLKGISDMKHPDYSNSGFRDLVSLIYKNMDNSIRDPNENSPSILYIRKKMMEDNETWDEVNNRLK
jgi:hypothetical protein